MSDREKTDSFLHIHKMEYQADIKHMWNTNELRSAITELMGKTRKAGCKELTLDIRIITIFTAFLEIFVFSKTITINTN